MIANPIISRRDAMERVATLLGGLTLVGGDQLLAAGIDATTQNSAMASGVGEFTAADVAWLDEIAETILPATDTPGAKAAHTGSFMALMVTAAYTRANQQIFRGGMRQLEERCEAMHGVPFMRASQEQRLALLERLDGEQKAHMDARAGAPQTRAPLAASPAPETPVHYFRMMKELALLGYFTSEIGCMQAQRYVESPGRFEPCVPHKPGDKTWAPHA